MIGAMKARKRMREINKQELHSIFHELQIKNEKEFNWGL